MKFIYKLLISLWVCLFACVAFAQSNRSMIPWPSQAKTLFEESKILLSQLSADEQRYYAAFARQIQLDEQGLPDVSDPNTMKAYLAFYNLKKYGYHKQPPKGYITEDFPLLGYSSVEFHELEKSPYSLALTWLKGHIYNSAARFKMIPLSLQDKAQELALDILYDTLQERFNMTPDQLKQLLDATFTDDEISNCVHVYDTENEFNSWHLRISLTPQGFVSTEEFLPLGVMALHELLHVQNIFPGSLQGLKSLFSLDELPTSLQDIMLNDLIYKKLNNIPLEETVIYDTGSPLPIGEIAVFLHKLQQQYPNKNMTQLLILPELQEYIQQLYKDFGNN